MRRVGIVGALAGVGLCVVVACSSSNDAASSITPEIDAGTDAPSAPPADDGGADAGGDAGGIQHAGTRIRLHGVQTSEGAFVYGEPFDSKLGTVCFPVRTEDGVLRCVPQADASIAGFSDPGCTTPIASRTKGACGTLTFATRYISSDTDPCDTRFATYRIGPAMDIPKIYLSAGGACTGYDPSPDQSYYPVLGAVAPTDLVTFTESIVPLSSEIGAYVLDGDDGSRIQRDYFTDVKRGKACEANLGSDDQVHCTPRSKATTGGFSDPACATSAADPRECVVAYETFDDSTALRYGASKCGQNKVRAYPLAAKRASRAEFTSDGDGGCTGPVDSPRDVYDIGPEIAASTLPALVPATAGGPRIVQGTLVTGTVIAKYDPFRLADSTLGNACHFSTAADGKLRCLPDGPGAFLYADDKCTVQLAVQTEDCAPVKYLLRLDKAACATTHVHVPGTKLAAATPTFSLASNGIDCLPVGGSNSIAFYTFGAELPAGTFEEGTVVTR